MSKLPKLVNPREWPQPSGYANATVGQGKIVSIAGQVGWDPITERMVSDNFTQQSRQAIANVLSALEAAGGKAENLVRLTWFITDSDAYLANKKQIGKAYREELGKHYPAMSIVVVAGLLVPGAKVEIEGMALLAGKGKGNSKKSKK
ncbi:MAG: enamine deaminase RidA [Acidobacteria bacterium]|nr:MAG: enamine deaminase RidA [Acidobacteriota bacterium]PYY24502.1 MAG: enamine deaminase RidA [Acidobacteriota bacterium]